MRDCLNSEDMTDWEKRHGKSSSIWKKRQDLHLKHFMHVLCVASKT